MNSLSNNYQKFFILLFLLLSLNFLCKSTEDTSFGIRLNIPGFNISATIDHGINVTLFDFSQYPEIKNAAKIGYNDLKSIPTNIKKELIWLFYTEENSNNLSITGGVLLSALTLYIIGKITNKFVNFISYYEYQYNIDLEYYRKIKEAELQLMYPNNVSKKNTPIL